MHTPGPWKVSRTETGYIDIEGGRSGKTWIARLISNNATAESVQANARLIACAPEVERLARELAESIVALANRSEKDRDAWEGSPELHLARRLLAALEGKGE